MVNCFATFCNELLTSNYHKIESGILFKAGMIQKTSSYQNRLYKSSYLRVDGRQHEDSTDNQPFLEGQSLKNITELKDYSVTYLLSYSLYFQAFENLSNSPGMKKPNIYRMIYEAMKLKI